MTQILSNTESKDIKNDKMISKLYHFLLSKGIKEKVKAEELFNILKEINTEILLLRYGNNPLTVKEIARNLYKSEEEIIFRINVIKKAIKSICGLILEPEASLTSLNKVSVDEEVEHAKKVRRLLNLLKIIENDKIRKVIDSIYPRDFNIFINLHPIFYDESIPINLLIEEYKMTEEETWRISDKIIFTIQKITGKTIPSRMLSERDSSRNVVFTYNLKLKQLLSRYNVTDIGIVYRVSKAIVLKDLLIYLSYKPIDGSDSESINDISIRLKISTIEVEEAISRVDTVLKEYGCIDRSIDNELEKSKKIVQFSYVMEQRINNRKGKVQALLNYYGISDKEKIDLVSRKITKQDLNRYLYKIGMQNLLSREEISQVEEAKKTRIWSNSISAVKRLLKDICKIEYIQEKYDHSRRISEKIKNMKSRVKIVLEYYGIFDEDKIAEVCKRIFETELNTYLAYLNGSLDSLEQSLNKKSIKIYIARVNRILTEVCGITFEKTLDDVPEEILSEITEFMYSHRIREASIIKKIILDVGIQKLQIFISAVKDGQHHKKTVELGLNNDSVPYYVSYASDKIYKISGIRIETKYNKEKRALIIKDDSNPIGSGTARIKRKKQVKNNK